MAIQEKVRIAFDFGSRVEAIEWFNSLKGGGAVDEKAAAFRMTLEDMKKGCGVTPSNTYLVLLEGDRDENERLKEKFVVREYDHIVA